MSFREGRFSRWSRLKQAGGESPTKEQALKYEDDPDPAVDSSEEIKAGESSVASHSLEKTANSKKSGAPVMTPLAGYEEGDTDFEAPPAEAIQLLENEKKMATGLERGSVEKSSGEERPLTDEEMAIVSELPSLDSLTKESDFTPFLAEKVPGFIRRRALSILWRSNPIFAHLDGLNDYDEDFNVIDKLIDALTDSNYRVGKGMGSGEDQATKEVSELEEGKDLKISDPSKEAKDTPSNSRDNTTKTNNKSPSNKLAKNSKNNQDIKGTEESTSNQKEIEKSEIASSKSLRNVRKPGG